MFSNLYVYIHVFGIELHLKLKTKKYEVLIITVGDVFVSIQGKLCAIRNQKRIVY